MMYVIMALDLLGYPKDHPGCVRKPRSQFMNLLVDDERGFFFQPCFSPVWDTAIAAYALGESGVVPAQALTPRGRLVACRRKSGSKGDWSIKRPNVEPSGWYFEFANEYYPDIDDTAQVLLALAQAHRFAIRQAQEASRKRAIDWLLAMQVKDGGWAAFDVDNNWNFLSSGALRGSQRHARSHLSGYHRTRAGGADRVCGVKPKASGRAARGRIPEAHPGSRRQLVRTLGRGLHLRHVPGSARLAGCGRKRPRSLYPARRRMAAVHSERRRRLGRKLRQLRQPHLHARPSTPSQTAWAVLGLLAGGDTTSSSVHKGIEYLMETQRSDGGWDEELSTGTGFPGRFLFASITLPAFVPGSGAGSLPESQRSNPVMRFPISQAASMATYIAKNKLRPRPEWQKNLAPYRGREEPVPHRPRADSGGSRGAQAASDDQQALSAGDDAGTAARLQSDLHRLRTHSRIRNVDPRAVDAGAVPESRRRVRRADGLDLRRRTVSLSGTAQLARRF